MIILRKLLIGNVMIEYCVSSLNDYLYHINYVCILSKIVYENVLIKDYDSTPGSIVLVQVYAIRLSVNFSLEI